MCSGIAVELRDLGSMAWNTCRDRRAGVPSFAELKLYIYGYITGSIEPAAGGARMAAILR